MKNLILLCLLFNVSFSVRANDHIQPFTVKGGITIPVSTFFAVVEVNSQLISVVNGETGEQVIGVDVGALMLVDGTGFLVSKVSYHTLTYPPEDSEAFWVLESPELCVDSTSGILKRKTTKEIYRYKLKSILIPDLSVLNTSTPLC